MALKDILYRFRPTQLYIVLVLSICYFCLQMILSHITHALTLLLSSYHMLCNIFALTGCIITIKNNKNDDEQNNIRCGFSRNFERNLIESGQQIQCSNLSVEEESLRNTECLERKLKNTFGWTRIDVLTMLIVGVILASLSFSLLVEALQTLVHIDHQDSMHLPVAVMILGFVGLIINGICYLLIGGYTRHQDNFLHISFNGDVIMEIDKMNGDFERNTPVTVNADAENASIQYKESFLKLFRDVSSTIFVIACAFIVYMLSDDNTAKFIDPVLSILSCVVLGTLSYPYMKESCLILLQTIPASIDIDVFEKTLTSKFPEIVSYHDLHIWQLTADKYVSTVHIKFKSQKLYIRIINDIRAFFLDQGISIVTIQPEFDETVSPGFLECLVKCNTNACVEKVCCQ